MDNAAAISCYIKHVPVYKNMSMDILQMGENNFQLAKRDFLLAFNNYSFFFLKCFILENVWAKMTGDKERVLHYLTFRREVNCGLRSGFLAWKHVLRQRSGLRLLNPSLPQFYPVAFEFYLLLIGRNRNLNLLRCIFGASVSEKHLP